MSISSKIFIKHPKTEIMYSLREAALIIDVSINTLYQRIRKGDKGTRLWRPREIIAKFPPDNRTKEECDQRLHQIPKPTKFDNL